MCICVCVCLRVRVSGGGGGRVVAVHILCWNQPAHHLSCCPRPLSVMFIFLCVMVKTMLFCGSGHGQMKSKHLGHKLVK